MSGSKSLLHLFGEYPGNQSVRALQHDIVLVLQPHGYDRSEYPFPESRWPRQRSQGHGGDAVSPLDPQVIVSEFDDPDAIAERVPQQCQQSMLLQ